MKVKRPVVLILDDEDEINHMYDLLNASNSLIRHLFDGKSSLKCPVDRAVTFRSKLFEQFNDHG